MKFWKALEVVIAFFFTFSLLLIPLFNFRENSFTNRMKQLRKRLKKRMKRRMKRIKTGFNSSRTKSQLRN